MFKQCLIYFFVIFFCRAFTSSAQNVYHSYLTIDNGLVNNEVTAIKQDKYGFLWFGTRGGLNKYDGYELKLIRNTPDSRNNLSSQGIEVLCEGKNDIWVGTKTGGLNRYNLLNDSIYHYSLIDSPGIQNILSLYETPNGDLYIGSSIGFYILEKKTQKFKLINRQARVYDIKSDGAHGLWLASGQGLLRLNSKNKIVFHHRFGFRSVTLSSLAVDRKNNVIYIGTWGKGLFCYNYKNGNFKRYLSNSTNTGSLSSNNTYKLFLDKSNNLWVGTWGGGLNKFNIASEDFTRFKLTSIDNFNYDNRTVLSIEQDRSGVIWLGTEGGLYRINPRKKKFHTISYQYNNAYSLTNTHIVSVFTDSNGALWAGTKDGGLEYSSDHKKFQRVRLEGGSEDVVRINTIFQDQHKLWIGTGNGLFIINGLKPSDKIDYVHSGHSLTTLSGDKVTAVVKDIEGTIWVGTQETGLNRVIGYSAAGLPMFKRYSPSTARNDLQSERVSCMYNDSKGRLWIGTYNGLHLYDRKTDSFINYVHHSDRPGTISNSIILCISEDRKGNIWVGTQNGLNKLLETGKAISFTSYFSNDNFPNDYIHAILPDKNYRIWISTNKGIVCLNTLNNEFRTFDMRDGLSSNAFSENAAYLSKNGKMYFGGIKGITWFHPDSIEINTILPPIYFTKLLINNTEVKVGQEIAGTIPLTRSLFATKNIRLNYKQDFVSLSFAALDYHATDKNQYAYRLKGFEDEWVNSGKRRTATYTNLPPGNYTLEVIASNSDNIWNRKGAALQIKVLPPPWKTWWAYTIYISVFLFLLWLSRHIGLSRLMFKNKLEIANLSLKREREITEIKSKLFTNISHEFRTPLTLMIGPLYDLTRNENLTSEIRKSLSRVQDQAKRLLNLVNQLLDYQKAESDKLTLNAVNADLVSFSREIFQSFSNEARRRNIRFHFRAVSNQILCDFDKEKMTTILYNLLSNAFKFSESGGHVKLLLNTIVDNEKQYCELTVTDTGQGIKESEMDKIFDRYYQVAKAEAGKFAGTGIGLAFTKDLVLLHQGNIRVESEPGKGSAFHVLLPLTISLTNTIPDNQDTVELDTEPELEENCTDDNADKPLVLIVEDNVEVNEYLVSILKPLYQTISASTGREGFSKAVSLIPDMVISDVMMPEMDGYEFCSKLKTDLRTSHIPVMLLTAQSDFSSQIKGVNEGADIYLSKPFHPGVLLSHVNNSIEARKKLKELFKKRINLGPSEIEITSFDEEFIRKTVTKIEENLTNPEFQTDHLAPELNMSRSTFYRKLKALTGMSGSEFIRYIRIKRSAQLLLSEEFTINQIAYEVGFNDTKHFRKCFFKQFEMTPSEYLKKEKGHLQSEKA